MKIRSYELFKLPPRWLFLKIETDEGITGWGEPIVEGRADTVKAAVDELMQTLLGKDPMQIEDHWNTISDVSVFNYQDGYVQIPAEPGLGITINEPLVREKAKQGHNWKNPVWRHGDGSVAEW